jgi:hypothetical protein
MLLVADDQRLIRSSYTDSKLAPKAGKNWIHNPAHPVLEQAMSELDEYLGAKRALAIIASALVENRESERFVNLLRRHGERRSVL